MVFESADPDHWVTHWVGKSQFLIKFLFYIDVCYYLWAFEKHNTSIRTMRTSVQMTVWKQNEPFQPHPHSHPHFSSPSLHIRTLILTALPHPHACAQVSLCASFRIVIIQCTRKKERKTKKFINYISTFTHTINNRHGKMSKMKDKEYYIGRKKRNQNHQFLWAFFVQKLVYRIWNRYISNKVTDVWKMDIFQTNVSKRF